MSQLSINKTPEIIVNGKMLTDNEALTLQYAIDRYDCFLANKGLGDDLLAEKITVNYRKNIAYFRYLIKP